MKGKPCDYADIDTVIAVHCNHGKGRTGTAILCILLFSDISYRSVEEVSSFYNESRFSKQSYKVDQPCQLRYI
jgi:protein tyrosine/serine phosphatase